MKKRLDERDRLNKASDKLTSCDPDRLESAQTSKILTSLTYIQYTFLYKQTETGFNLDSCFIFFPSFRLKIALDHREFWYICLAEKTVDTCKSR